jgi:hypothetical protein
MIKKISGQVIAAVLIYTLISLILEKDFSWEALQKEGAEGLIFGLFYGVFLLVWNVFKKRNAQE